MKKPIYKLALFCALLFSSVPKFYSQLASSPTLATSNVTEAAQYDVLYQLDLPTSANFSSLASILYSINNSSLSLNYTRVAYFLQLDSKWVWVSMNKFNTTNDQLGLPYSGSGIMWQQTVSGMNVYSSVGAGVTNTTGASGNLEIWPDCYDTPAGLGGIGGNGSTYDFDDTPTGGDCYGSFQIHDYSAAETVFAFNSFMAGSACDLGIGNNTGNGNPDWTFMGNASSYTTLKLWILVNNSIGFINPPSPLAQTACINGTVSALTVSTAINSATVTDYQWYSNSTASSAGGTLVASHTSSLTTDSYSPSALAGGTLYYYCVANCTTSSGSFGAASEVSGGISVENPTVIITGSGTICAQASLTLATSSSVSASTFTWSNGANTSSIVVSPGLTTNYSVSITSTTGCVGASPLTAVTINTLPVISVPNGTICNGNSFVMTPAGAVSYTYSSGTSTVTPGATTSYTVSGTSAAGCVGSNTAMSVVVNALPVVSVTGTTAICTGSSASLTANGALTYTWSNGSHATGITVNPTVTTSYSLSGTSAQGCASTLQAVSMLTVNALPVLSISGTTAVCAGSSATLTANGASTYTWNTSATTSFVAVTPATITSYSVSGTSTLGCVNTASATVSVNSLPLLSITGTTLICAGNSASLTANGAATYTWSTGSNTAGVSVSPSVNTTYSASGTSSAGCISATPAVVSVSVNALPTVSITGPTSICAGSSASLTANGAATYTWSTGSNTTGISVSPSVNTTYSVTGTSTAGCLGLAAVSNITVNALPVVIITGTPSICAGTTASLTLGGATTYTWTGGLGSSTVLAVSPSVTTTYTATGTSTAGCTNFATKTVTVNALPVLVIGGASGICTGQNASLTVSGASTYSWSNGATGTAVVTAPTVNTTYTVTGTSTLGCVNTNSQLVTVTPSLSVSITGPSAICLGQPLLLLGSGGATYTWNTGATTATVASNPTVTTTYSVTGASGTCSNTAVKTVIVNANPTVTIGGSTTVCAGGSATLTAAGATSYTWANAATATTAVFTPTPSATTVYSVSGSFTTGCSSIAAITVSVHSLPTLSVSGTNLICSGESANLTVSGAANYTWSNGATTNTVSVNPASNTTLSATGTDSNGCVNSVTTGVTVNPVPSLSVTSSATAVCPGATATLQVSGANNYTWSTGATTSVIATTPGTTTNYTVTGTNTFACSSSSVIAVTVNTVPVIAITGPTVACENETIELVASGANSYTWSTGVTSATLDVIPSIVNPVSVTGTNAEGCEGSASTQVTILISCINGLPTLSAVNKTRVYPNPTNGNLTIELEDATDVTITICNVLGQVVASKKAELTTALQLSEFNNGMYYITVAKNNVVVYKTSVIKN